MQLNAQDQQLSGEYGRLRFWDGLGVAYYFLTSIGKGIQLSIKVGKLGFNAG